MGMVIKSNMKYSNHIVVIVIYCDYFLNFSQFFSIFLNFSQFFSNKCIGQVRFSQCLARSDFSQFFSIFHFCSFFLIFYHFLTFYFMLLLFFTSFWHDFSGIVCNSSFGIHMCQVCQQSDITDQAGCVGALKLREGCWVQLSCWEVMELSDRNTVKRVWYVMLTAGMSNDMI